MLTKKAITSSNNRLDDPAQRERLFIVLYNILLTNDLAVSYVAASLGELQKTNIYKGEVKFRTKQVYAAMRAYNDILNKAVGRTNIEFLADLNDRLEIELKEILSQLAVSTSLVINRHKAPCSEFLTKASIAQTLCEIAVGNAKMRIEEQPQTIRYFASRFRCYNIQRIDNAFMQLMKAVHKENSRTNGKYNIDLREDMNIGNGFMILIDKLRDISILSKVIYQTEKDFDDDGK